MLGDDDGYLAFDAYIREVDGRLHDRAGDGVIGVVWVNESSALWSGPGGFVEAERLGKTLASFAVHANDAPTPQDRFGEELTPATLDGVATRIAACLGIGEFAGE